MATTIPKSHEFTVDVVGDSSAEVFKGKFDLKTVLSHGEQLRRDELRRFYLGANNNTTPTPRAASQAEVLAEINSRINGEKGAPSWWAQAQGGLSLVDDNVLRAINDGLDEGLAKRAAAVKEAIAEARGEVKTLAAAQG
jgi:hypothetical protein